MDKEMKQNESELKAETVIPTTLTVTYRPGESMAIELAGPLRGDETVILGMAQAASIHATEIFRRTVRDSQRRNSFAEILLGGLMQAAEAEAAEGRPADA